MIKRLTIVLLMLCGIKGVYAQSNHGLIFGLNKMMYQTAKNDKPYNIVNADDYHAKIGYEIGYRYAYSINKRMAIGTGLNLIRYKLECVYWTYIDNDLVIYMGMPVDLSYEVFSNCRFSLGYQYSHLLTAENTDGNRNDHAATIGFAYHLKQFQFRLLYQYSVNIESDTRGTPQMPEYTHYYKQVEAIHFQVLVSLNKLKDKKD